METKDSVVRRFLASKYRLASSVSKLRTQPGIQNRMSPDGPRSPLQVAPHTAPPVCRPLLQPVPLAETSSLLFCFIRILKAYVNFCHWHGFPLTHGVRRGPRARAALWVCVEERRVLAQGWAPSATPILTPYLPRDTCCHVA